MRWWMACLAAAVLLLLAADVLAFHDLFEPHTVRDWLMLAGSALVVIGVAGSVLRRSGSGARQG
jgi:multisubunit Na+/H+ antiporter MnhB subunit